MTEMPPRSHFKKAVMPISKLIKESCRRDRSNLHERWTFVSDQDWRRVFVQNIKMIIKVDEINGKMSRSTVFRKRPIYPPMTWFRKCCCNYCRRMRWKLFVPEDTLTIRRCEELKPAKRLRPKECGDRCHEVLAENGANLNGKEIK